MNKQPTPFPIVFTEKVVFRDRLGDLVKMYEVGDVVYATAELNHSYVTTMGGILHSEARKVTDLELVTYAHANGGGYKCRFRQFAKDPLPGWAVDVKLETKE